MELRGVGFERYKGYGERAEIELAPLTILVGANDSGKSALARAVPLVAGGIAPAENDAGEPLPLAARGLRHGRSFEDIVAGRAVHGSVSLALSLSLDGRNLLLEATVQNVVAPNQSSQRQVTKWRLRRDPDDLSVERVSLDEDSAYRVSSTGASSQTLQIPWRGLLPAEPQLLAPWAATPVSALRHWAAGVRYLQCPRTLPSAPFLARDNGSSVLDADGQGAALLLVSDDELQESVGAWYRDAFGARLDIRSQGSYADLVIRAPTRGASVLLAQSGAGLSQALPVVVAAMTARRAGAGVDIIEHPEAELHPRVHAEVLDLLLNRLPGPQRPVLVETHSEMFLLRARRRIAEGRLSPDQVLVYWVRRDPRRGSVIRKIRITEQGEMDAWPDDVFIEDYEEVLAIRRANRPRG